MSKFHPMTAVAWAVAGVGLPLLCAALITDPGFRADVLGRAKHALSASDLTEWADVALDGRIATLSGKTTNPEAPAAAVDVVASTDGVRTVVNEAVVEPLVLVPPTVESLTSSASVTSLRGTWPEAVAKKLVVTVGPEVYSLPGNPELTTRDGQWLLNLKSPLAPGSYEVMATASVESDGANVSRSADAPGRIVVSAAAADASASETAGAPAVAPQPAEQPALDTPAVALVESESAATGSTQVVEPAAQTGQPAESAASAAAQAEASAAANSGAEIVQPSVANSETVTTVPAAAPPEAPAVTAGDAAEATEQAGAQVSDAAGTAAESSPPAGTEPEPAEQQATAQQPPSPLSPAPTIERQLDLTGAPVILGTWPDADGVGLTVTLAGRVYELGKSANLVRRSAGKWKLLPSAALKDGIYDVVVTAKRGGEESKDQTVAEIEVDATPPAVPTVKVHASDTAPTSVSGTYDARRTARLVVSIPELSLGGELGTPGSPLTADGDGQWALAIQKPVPPGTYNVVVTSTDKRGRSVDDATAGEISVSAPQQPAPKTDASFSCIVTMQRISTVFPMRFIFDKIDFQERFGLSVSQYAALLKDSRCKSVSVEVGGHADEQGSDSYNEDLAERRAIRVRDMLVEAGVASPRLSVASYGESVPLNPGHDESAWSVNRRVEIKIEK